MSLSSRDSSSRDTTLLFQIFTIIRISYIILFFFRIVVLWEGRVFSISAQKASLLVFVSLSGIFVSFKITDFFFMFFFRQTESSPSSSSASFRLKLSRLLKSRHVKTWVRYKTSYYDDLLLLHFKSLASLTSEANET